MGLECDHQVLKQEEAKNFVKLGFFNESWRFLRGFWLLAVLKHHGRIPNLENRILWFLLDL